MQTVIVFATILAVAFAGNYEKSDVAVKQDPAGFEYKVAEVKAEDKYVPAFAPTFYNAPAFPGYAYAVKSYEAAPIAAPAPAVATVYKADTPVAPVVTFKKFEAPAAPAAVAVKTAYAAPAFAAPAYGYGYAYNKPAFYNYAPVAAAAPAFYNGAYKYAAAPYAYQAAAYAPSYYSSFAAPAPGYGFNYGYGYSY